MSEKITWFDLFLHNKQNKTTKLLKSETQALNAIARFSYQWKKMSVAELHDQLSIVYPGQIRNLGKKGILNAKSGLEKLSCETPSSISEEIDRLKIRIAELEKKRQQILIK